MAVTKTHPIKSTLKSAIDYICNPEKTDGKLLVAARIHRGYQVTYTPGHKKAVALIKAIGPG